MAAFRSSGSDGRTFLLQVANTIRRTVGTAGPGALTGKQDPREEGVAAVTAPTVLESDDTAGVVLEEDTLLTLHVDAVLLRLLEEGSPGTKHLLMLDWAASKVPQDDAAPDAILASLLATCRAAAALPACQQLGAPPPAVFDASEAWNPSPREVCPLCRSPVAMRGDTRRARCEAGHTLERCVFDLTLVATPKLDRCPVCARYTLNVTDPNAVLRS